jgi:hypothetical protein
LPSQFHPHILEQDAQTRHEGMKLLIRPRREYFCQSAPSSQCPKVTCHSGLVYPTLRTWRQSINSPPLELPLLPALIPLALNPVPSHLLRNHGRRHGCQPDIAPLLVRVFYQLADDPAERGGNSENLCPLVLFREIPFFLAVGVATFNDGSFAVFERISVASRRLRGLPCC